MANHMLDEWTVRDEDYPADGSNADKLRFLVRYAILAPSEHNVQPWRFVLGDEHLELHRDERRKLPAIDPDGRELTISCGAALYNLRLAARHFGNLTHVDLCPYPSDPELLAVVRLIEGNDPSEDEEDQFKAIARRHTNRRAFFDKDVPETVVPALVDAVEQEHAWLHVLDERQKRNAARLVFEGDRLQESDRSFRRELGRWLQPNSSQRRNGIPTHAFGIEGMSSYIRPVTMQWLGWGDDHPYEDRELAEDTPLMVVVGSEADDRASWIRAGQALEHLLLRACADGLCASWFNQPVEVPALRRQLADMLHHDGVPQLLLGLGYGFLADPTPRMSVDSVLFDARSSSTH